MTPPIAWLPQITELGPRSTSTDPILPVRIELKSNAPEGDDGSLMRTPSTSTSVCELSPPRMNTLVVPPGPPLRATLMPGSVCSTSLSTWVWRRSSSALSTTVIDWPVSLRFWTMRLAETTISSSWSSLADCAWSGVATARASADTVKLRMNLDTVFPQPQPPPKRKGR